MKAVRLYAQVLVDVLSAPNSKFSMEVSLNQLDGFAKLLSESSLMVKVFDNPILPEEDKIATLKQFGKKMEFSPLTERFLSMLVKRNRIGVLPQVLSEVESIQIQKSGGLIGELTTAVSLDGATISAISQAVSKKMNKTVRLKEKVDPSLIAGLRVTVGGKTFDSSVQTKLNKVKESLQ
jgi:F-type H+-transporting ATPase subunit delta